MGAENFPPKISENNDDQLPVCPFFERITACAELAGFEITNESFFCGTIEKPKDTLRYLLREGALEEPKSECSEIYIKLISDFRKANQEVEVPDEKKLREDIKNMPLNQMRTRLNEWHELKTKKKDQDKIIERWRQIIWKEYEGPTSEGRNRMFHGFKEPEELTNQYVIDYIGEFLESLGKIVNRNGHYYSDIGGREIQAGTQAMYKEQCPQSPKQKGAEIIH